MARSFMLQSKLGLIALVLNLAAYPAFCQEQTQHTAVVLDTSSELEQVTAGPLAVERQKVLDMILSAKEQKIGIAAYMGAFKSLEDQVKAGAQEKQIKNRLESISISLNEQLKRSKELKLQKPAPPVAASSPTPVESGSKSSLDLGGSNTDKMINKLRDKWFGGEIPDSIKKKIPAGIDPSKMDNDTIKDLLKKYGQ